MSARYDQVIDSDVAETSEHNSLQFQDCHADESLENGTAESTSGFFNRSNNEGGLSSKAYLWSIDYYSQFFNVTSESVTERLLNAVSRLIQADKHKKLRMIDLPHEKLFRDSQWSTRSICLSLVGNNGDHRSLLFEHSCWLSCKLYRSRTLRVSVLDSY